MAKVEERLAELLDVSAPPATPVDFDDVLARVRRRRRTRLSVAAGGALTVAAVAALLVAGRRRVAGPRRVG